jgi:hypothetical protein
MPRKLPAQPDRVGKRYLAAKKIIAIYKAPGRGVDIAAEFNVSPATVTQIKRGDRHYNITNPLRLAASINAELVTMACGVDLL